MWWKPCMYNLITASFITLQASVTIVAGCWMLMPNIALLVRAQSSHTHHHPSPAQQHCPSVHLATRTAKKSHRLSCLLGLGQLACEKLPLKHLKYWKKYFCSELLNFISNKVFLTNLFDQPPTCFFFDLDNLGKVNIFQQIHVWWL